MYYVCKMCQWTATAVTTQAFVQVVLDHMADHIQEAGSGVACQAGE